MISQAQACGQAFEELAAQILLGQQDLAVDGGSRDVQMLGGAADGSEPGRGDEIAYEAGKGGQEGRSNFSNASCGIRILRSTQAIRNIPEMSRNRAVGTRQR
jgi:hypothetical protein